MRWQAALLGIAATVAIDIVAAYLLLAVVSPDSEERGVAVALIVIAAWAVQLYATVKLAVLTLALRSDAAAKGIAAMLAREGFPPAARHDNAARYLATLVDTSTDDQLRDRALFLQGERAGYIGGGGLIKALAFERTWDRAIQLIG